MLVLSLNGFGGVTLFNATVRVIPLCGRGRKDDTANRIH